MSNASRARDLPQLSYTHAVDAAQSSEKAQPIVLEQVRELLDILPCAALLIDPAGTMLHINRAAEVLIGRSARDLVGGLVHSLYPDHHPDRPLVESLARFPEPGEIETTLHRGDGGTRHVIAAFRHIDIAGRPGGVRLVTLTDIHKLKDTQAGLKFQQEFLVQMSDTVMQQALALKELNQKLEDRVARRTAQLHSANMDAIYMLAVAAEAKDRDTGAHVLRVQRYVHALATACGLCESDADEIGYSAILHDVGKLHVPDHILQKPGPLTDDERRAMEEHTIAGERILSRAPFFRRARLIARSHHEHFDGTGYPDRLAGQAIPIEARIVHVADVFDALTHDRVYKEAWDPTDAVEMIRAGAGTQFDPDVANCLVKLHLTGELCDLTRGFCEFKPNGG